MRNDQSSGSELNTNDAQPRWDEEEEEEEKDARGELRRSEKKWSP